MPAAAGLRLHVLLLRYVWLLAVVLLLCGLEGAEVGARAGACRAEVRLGDCQGAGGGPDAAVQQLPACVQHLASARAEPQCRQGGA